MFIDTPRGTVIVCGTPLQSKFKWYTICPHCYTHGEQTDHWALGIDYESYHHIFMILQCGACGLVFSEQYNYTKTKKEITYINTDKK